MNYLFDTNILLEYLRNTTKASEIEDNFNFYAVQNKLIISVVTVGEIRSIALRNNWGERRIETLENTLDNFIIADINAKPIINRYAIIDTFSQGKLKNFPLSNTARNMGKNDLWIASTASILGIPLVTMDKDFSHLKDTFLDLILI